MPIRQTTDRGRPAYQWGASGKKYTYNPRDRRDRERARQQALKQGQAIEASKARGKT